jgi:signal transduction histidine kinase
MSALSNDTIDLLKLNAEKKDVMLISDIPEGSWVYADRNMIATTLRNLLTNAIKFMDKAGEVRVVCIDKEEIIEIRVQDQGIGMSSEDLEKLFRIDVNTRHIGRSKEKGTGLGLILCKEFIESNGGTIRAESEPGQGSVFIFTLPKPAGKD